MKPVNHHSRSPKPTIVNCPTCMRPVVWSDESPWKPFCSERCKLIDLGAWADESYTIPGETVMPENMED